MRCTNSPSANTLVASLVAATIGLLSSSVVASADASSHEETPTEARYIAIVDIDGTIADERERRREATDENGDIDWDAYFDPAKALMDKPIDRSAQVLHRLRNSGVKIVYLSSRSESLYDATDEWLDNHDYPDGPIRLRPRYDRTHEFKLAEVRKAAENGEIIVALGDRQSDFDVYEEAGVRYLRVEGVEPGEWQTVEKELGEILSEEGLEFAEAEGSATGQP